MSARFVLLVLALAFSHISGMYRAEAAYRVGWGRPAPGACLAAFVLTLLMSVGLGTEVLR